MGVHDLKFYDVHLCIRTCLNFPNSQCQLPATCLRLEFDCYRTVTEALLIIRWAGKVKFQSLTHHIDQITEHEDQIAQLQCVVCFLCCFLSLWVDECILFRVSMTAERKWNWVYKIRWECHHETTILSNHWLQTVCLYLTVNCTVSNFAFRSTIHTRLMWLASNCLSAKSVRRLEK